MVAKKHSKKKHSLKKMLIVIGIVFVVLVIIITFVFKLLYSNAVNLSEYQVAQKRCHSDELVIGSIGLYGDKYYHPLGTRPSRPSVDAHYFCTNADAEAAGYKNYDSP